MSELPHAAQQPGRLHPFPVFRHDGPAKTFYNAFLILAALAGTIITSYRLTFQHFQFDAVYWLISIVYLLDIPYTFNQAVKRGLVVSSDRRTIARVYLRRWFALDVIAGLPLAWVVSLIAGPAAESPTGAVLGILVATKILKMAKIGKVSAIFREIRESLSVNPSLMRLLTFAFWFVTVVHLMACGWVLIGAAEPQRSHFDQYLRGVYWCVTTIATIGYGDYTPSHDSNLQIVYTIVVMVFGVGMYGYIIGNVASLIVNLDVARAAYQEKMEEVNDFFRTRRVPGALQARVKDYYAYLWETQKSVSSVSITDELPHTLSTEILLYLNRTILSKVSLFKNANEIFIREIVGLLRPMVFLPDDYIIRQGEYGDCMYFLSSGEVEVLVGDTKVAQLDAGSPFGETALIQGEKRVASIRALTYCDVYKLAKSDFDALRSRYPEFDAQVKKIVEDRIKDAQEKTQK
ncbi:MAG TPA: cyclic nucleotide-binding domain-containing protein [Spirochaetia bacterium]|nr:cyclic nucleotide-binding domain-containing protein [Spirochaetia bacterium]